MKLSIKQIESLQEIIRDGISTSRPASKWLQRLSSEWEFGEERRGKIHISFDELSKLKRAFISNGYPLAHDSCDLESRTNAGLAFGDEKLADAVTAQRVFVAFKQPTLSQDSFYLPAFRAMDMTVSELLAINPTEAVMIENLELLLESKKFENLLGLLSEDAVLVYRGGKGVYSPKGSKNFFEKYTGVKTGFFDYDPAGLCRLGHDFLGQLILPSIEFLERSGSAFSNADLYDQQIFKYENCLLNLKGSLKRHIELMRKKRLAIVQEKLIQIPLVKNRL